MKKTYRKIVFFCQEKKWVKDKVFFFFCFITGDLDPLTLTRKMGRESCFLNRFRLDNIEHPVLVSLFKLKNLRQAAGLASAVLFQY